MALQFKIVVNFLIAFLGGFACGICWDAGTNEVANFLLGAVVVGGLNLLLLAHEFCITEGKI